MALKRVLINSSLPLEHLIIREVKQQFQDNDIKIDVSGVRRTDGMIELNISRYAIHYTVFVSIDVENNLPVYRFYLGECFMRRFDVVLSEGSLRGITSVCSYFQIDIFNAILRRVLGNSRMVHFAS